MNLTIKTATKRDLPEIRQLFKDSILNVAIRDYSDQEVAEWSKTSDNEERWLSLIENQRVLLALNNETIVGFISLKDHEYLDFLYVHYEFQRKGVAQFLYNRLEQLAIGLGAQELISDVSKTANPFFTKNGFNKIRENRNQRGSEVLINYRMRKKLTSI